MVFGYRYYLDQLFALSHFVTKGLQKSATPAAQQMESSDLVGTTGTHLHNRVGSKESPLLLSSDVEEAQTNNPGSHNDSPLLLSSEDETPLTPTSTQPFRVNEEVDDVEPPIPPVTTLPLPPPPPPPPLVT